MERVIIAGGSGLVGGYVLRKLVVEPGVKSIVALGRRAAGTSMPRVEERVVDFAALPPFPEADTVFCTLGTTIGKAGSQEAFRRVDHDAVVNLARSARNAGARQFLVVSAVGARAGSALFYYRVKGEMEQAVMALGYPVVHVLRPSMLEGPRAEQRLGERVGLGLMNALGPLLGSRRPIHAEVVANAMVNLARRETPGNHVHESGELHDLGRA